MTATSKNPNISVAPSNTDKGIKVTILSIVTNLVLIVLKLIGGTVGHSYALIADAMHSLSDVATDIGVYFALTVSSKPKDRNHRYGHGKVDNYVAHIIGVILVIFSLAMAYETAKAFYFHDDKTTPGIIAIVMAFISIIVKEALFQITIRTGKEMKSKSLVANAWHHRSDAFSSIAAMIGIGIAVIWPKLHSMDELMGFLIALFVANVGKSIAWDSFKVMIDTSPSEEFLKEVSQIACGIKGVEDVHDIRARFYASAIFIDMHVSVEPEITVKEGHDIAKQVEKKLLSHFTDVVDVTIHIDPRKNKIYQK
ncbi:MAG: cation diffusion facilitator family transporter [Candidatus Auribacterota bacterium]|jgi:cation diffusion facilitator family transporter|nr:cation diffusion facilitator family transporter [Candidatus Auribacterota bacterium]